MKKIILLTLALLSGFPLMAGAWTQDQVTDTLPNKFYYLDYFNCDMFVDHIAYKIISKEDRTVELTNLNPSYLPGDNWVYQMETMHIPETVTWHHTVYTVKAIGTSAFTYSYIQRIEIPSTVNEIKDFAFSDINGMGELIIPNSVTKIGDYAFSGSRDVMASGPSYPLKIVFPESLDSIGMGIFSYRHDYIPFPGKPTVIPAETYSQCGLSEWHDLPETVEVISNNAFSYNNFKTICLPKHLKEIGAYAFFNCNELKTVTVPASVTFIGYSAFGGSSDSGLCNLDTLRLLSATPPECKILWEGPGYKNTETVIVGPKGTVDAYCQAWGLSLTTVVESDEPATTISSPSSKTREISRCNLNGHRLKSPSKGINIIRYSDGTTKKEIVR